MSDYQIDVHVATQTMIVRTRAGEPVKTYTVATATKGVGEQYGSFQTPRGRHVIRAKIGAGQPCNTVFVRRRPTGEQYSAQLAANSPPNRDWILTRILWLCGQEPGKNRFGDVDTMKRKVYIHGSPDECPMGIPSSHGCVKMRNRDIVELFDMVPAGTPVMIHE